MWAQTWWLLAAAVAGLAWVAVAAEDRHLARRAVARGARRLRGVGR